jgi:uncharacterized membrane protein YeaQ/YmgE (transglycosylase-associated protein family)
VGAVDGLKRAPPIPRTFTPGGDGPPINKERGAMGILWMIVVGFVVGLIARAVMPGSQGLGIVMTAVLGIAGSVVAGFIGQAIGWYQAGQGAGFIGSLVGALVVLFIYGKVKSGAGGGSGDGGAST